MLEAATRELRRGGIVEHREHRDDFCLGAPLARLEAKVVFRTLLRRYADLQLTVPRSELTWRRSQSVRGLNALPLRVRR